MEYKDLIRKKIGRIADRLLTVLFSICILIIVFISFQVTTFTTFHIPSDSMYPALQAGNNVLVNKWIMGTRIFNIWDALEGKEVKIHRLPGVGKIKRNDVLVFNFPYPAKKDSLAMDVMLYYVKRCIALPGDTLEIRNGFYRIRGIEEKLGKTTCGTGRLSTTKTGIGCKDDNGKRTENTIHSNKTDERGNKEAGYQGIKYSFTIFAFSCTLGEKLFLYNLTF